MLLHKLPVPFSLKRNQNLIALPFHAEQINSQIILNLPLLILLFLSIDILKWIMDNNSCLLTEPFTNHCHPRQTISPSDRYNISDAIVSTLHASKHHRSLAYYPDFHIRLPVFHSDDSNMLMRQTNRYAHYVTGCIMRFSLSLPASSLPVRKINHSPSLS